MSWHFSRELVEAYSAANSSDGRPSAPLSGMFTPQAYLSPDRMKAFSHLSRFGMTCEPLTGTLGEDVLTWCLEDSLARTFPPQERELVSTVREADSGKNLPESLARLDPVSFLWKTAQCLLAGDLEPFLGTWPRWGMMRDGVVYPQKIPAHLKDATEFGLLRGLSLVKLPTEQRTDGFAAGAGKKSCQAASVRTESGNAAIAGSGLTLFIMRNGTVALGAAPQMWLTPSANEDAAGTPKGAMQKMLGNHPDIRGTSPEEWSRGTLNPTWVEWLMGWPLGWTDLKLSATDKVPQWLRSHGGC